MQTARADITAEVLGPTRLMNRLAKHWAHKFEVELDEEQAVIPFPAGRCVLRVDGALLHATVEADDPEVLAKLENVVADHLIRMAKEPLEISWQR